MSNREVRAKEIKFLKMLDRGLAKSPRREFLLIRRLRKMKVDADSVFTGPVPRQRQQPVRTPLEVDRRKPDANQRLLAVTETLDHGPQIFGLIVLGREMR